MTTPQLEKVYFNYVLKNKKYFELVKTYFFKNSEIQFVYGVIREYILKSSDASKRYIDNLLNNKSSSIFVLQPIP